MQTPREILAAVEGLVDEAAIKRLAGEVGAVISVVFGKQGKHDLRQRLAAYNRSARFGPWIVLVDLNHDADCAPQLVREWLPQPNAGMCFRVVVRKIESWLLADRQGLANFLGVTANRIPANPEAEGDPKRTMVTLSRHSRRADIREDMVPRPGSGRQVGPAYTSRLIEFIQSSWNPDRAAQHSDSLRRCLRRLRELAQKTQQYDPAKSK